MKRIICVSLLTASMSASAFLVLTTFIRVESQMALVT